MQAHITNFNSLSQATQHKWFVCLFPDIKNQDQKSLYKYVQMFKGSLFFVLFFLDYFYVYSILLFLFSKDALNYN